MKISQRTLRFRVYLWLRRNNLYQKYNERIEQIVATESNSMAACHLNRLFAFVSEHNSYYSGLVGKSPDLESLPVLTKDKIRRNYKDLLSLPQGKGAYRNSSGGSTGHPVTLVQDWNYESWRNATQGFYFREFLGVDRDSVKNVWLWGSERDSMRIRDRRFQSACSRLLRNTVFLNTFEADETRWLEYIDKKRRFRPVYVAGYAGSLYQIARVARKNNIKLWRPAFVYSSAEMLRGFMREEIESQFSTKVYDFYGSREVGAIAGECSQGNLHVFVTNNIVEILNDDDHPVAVGEHGRIVVTNLHNYSFPIIRYDIGDTGALSGHVCRCGSKLPVLERLTGRVTDHFVLRDGGLVHGEFVTHLFYYRDWVDRFQVDQLDYDHLRVNIVRRDRTNDSDVHEISHNIRLVMGQGCEIEWQFVDSIDTTPQGKFRFTRNLMSSGTSGEEGN